MCIRDQSKFDKILPFIPSAGALDNRLLMGELMTYDVRSFDIHSIFNHLFSHERFKDTMRNSIRQSLSDNHAFFVDMFEQGVLRHYLTIEKSDDQWYVTLDYNGLYEVYKE